MREGTSRDRWPFWFSALALMLVVPGSARWAISRPPSDGSETAGLDANLTVQRGETLALLEGISDCVPEFVYLTALTDDSGMVLLEGRATKKESVTEFADCLERSYTFQTATVEDLAAPDGRGQLTFRIVAPRLRPISADKDISDPNEHDLTSSEELSAKLKTLRRILPERQDADELLQKLRQLAELSELTIEDVHRLPEHAHSFYVEVPFAIRAVGRYHDFASFCDKVRRHSRTVSITQTALQPHDEAEEGSRAQELDIRFVASIYTLE